MTTCEHSSVYDNSGKSVLVVRIVLLLRVLLVAVVQRLDRRREGGVLAAGVLEGCLQLLGLGDEDGQLRATVVTDAAVVLTVVLAALQLQAGLELQEEVRLGLPCFDQGLLQ